MLAKKYRISVENKSGGNLTGTSVFVTPWKYDSAGALEYQTQETPAIAAAADNDTEDSAAIDNETTKALGAHGRVTFTGGGSGDCYVYLQQSEDGVNWAGVRNYPIATITNPSVAGSVEFEI